MRIGRYTVPTIRIYPTLIDAVRRLYNRFQENEIDDLNAVAIALNHTSARSGAFLLKLTALRAYGLVDGRGKIYITELGSTLAYPKDRSEEERAFEKAITNIPLWHELYLRFGLELPQQGFAEELAKITGASIEEAKAKEAWIRSAYQNDILHLKSKPSLKEETQPKHEVKKESGYIELSAGEIYLKLPLTKEGIEALEAAVAILKNRLQQTIK
ncbi:MAG: hypothetical protein QXJ86_02505 [Nitrososphaerales archaeon]